MKAFNETIYSSEDVIATSFIGDGSGLTNVPLSGNEIAINGVFYENDTNITKDYTITEGKNAFCGGPITIDSSVTVTVPTGSNFTVI